MITNFYTSSLLPSRKPNSKTTVNSDAINQPTFSNTDTVSLRFRGENKPQLPGGLEHLRKLVTEDDNLLLLPPNSEEFHFLEGNVLPASYGKLKITYNGKNVMPQAPHIQASDSPVNAALRALFPHSDIETTLMNEKGLVQDRSQAKYVIFHLGKKAGIPKEKAQILVAPKAGFKRISESFFSHEPVKPYTAITVTFAELEKLGLQLGTLAETVNPYRVIKKAQENDLDEKGLLKETFIRPGTYIVLTYPERLPTSLDVSQKVMNNFEQEIDKGNFPLK